MSLALIMNMVLALLLIMVSARLVWLARPRKHQPHNSASNAEWSGESAARFAAGLVILTYALLAPITRSELHSVQLLMAQLSLYAAVPLLLSVALAQLINKPLSRMMWGRILLGWCVVFELLRHNNLLEQYQYILCAIGLLIGIASLFKLRDSLSYFALFSWTIMTSKPFIHTWINYL